MINSFNTNIAVQYGVNISIFCQQLAQWTFYNLANRKNIHDGLCWTYNTFEAYEAIFPYWTKSQLETVIKSATNAGLITKSNYNKTKYDRTCWYALTYNGLKFYPELTTERNLESLSRTISQKWEMYDEALSQQENFQIHFRNLRNEFLENRMTIPSTLPSNNLSKDKYIYDDVEKDKKKKYELNDLLKENPHDIPEQMLEDWMTTRKEKKAKVTRTAWGRINKTLTQIQQDAKISPVEAFEAMVTSGWLSLKVEYFMTKEMQEKRMQAHKRSLELEEMAARRKQQEIDAAKNANKIVTEASERGIGALRQAVGARKPINTQ